MPTERSQFGRVLAAPDGDAPDAPLGTGLEPNTGGRKPSYGRSRQTSCKLGEARSSAGARGARASWWGTSSASPPRWRPRARASRSPQPAFTSCPRTLPPGRVRCADRGMAAAHLRGQQPQPRHGPAPQPEPFQMVGSGVRPRLVGTQLMFVERSRSGAAATARVLCLGSTYPSFLWDCTLLETVGPSRSGGGCVACARPMTRRGLRPLPFRCLHPHVLPIAMHGTVLLCHGEGNSRCMSDRPL